jgi:hypothetical protein
MFLSRHYTPICLYPKLCGLSPQANYANWVTALLAKLVPTSVDRGCCVVSATDPHSRILRFLDWRHYFSIQAALQLSSRGWVDPVPDPLLLWKSGSTGNRTRDFWICSQELWPLDHRGGHLFVHTVLKFLMCNKYSRYWQKYPVLSSTPQHLKILTHTITMLKKGEKSIMADVWEVWLCDKMFKLKN